MPSDDEPPVLLEDLAVDGDPAALAQIADHVAVDGALVDAARLGIALADREVDRAADLLVEQDVARSAVDPVVGADPQLAQPPRAVVGVEQLVQEGLAALGACIGDPATLEAQPNSADLAPADHRREVKADLALDRILDRAGEELAVGHVVAPVGGDE